MEKRKALNHDLADVCDVSLSVESGVVKITGLDSETSTEDNLLQHNHCENSHQNGLQNGYPNGHTSESEYSCFIVYNIICFLSTNNVRFIQNL